MSERRIGGDLLQVMRSLDQLAKDLAGARPLRQPTLADTTVQDYPEIDARTSWTTVATLSEFGR